MADRYRFTRFTHGTLPDGLPTVAIDVEEEDARGTWRYVGTAVCALERAGDTVRFVSSWDRKGQGGHNPNP